MRAELCAKVSDGMIRQLFQRWPCALEHTTVMLQPASKTFIGAFNRCSVQEHPVMISNTQAEKAKVAKMGARKIQVRYQFRSERSDVNPHTEQMISIA